MSKTLVVGASGIVGQGVLEGLTEAGLEVRAATRDPASVNLPNGIARVHLDLRRPETFDGALDGVDRVFMLSPAGNVDAHALMAPWIETAASRVEKIVSMTAQGVETNDAIPLRQVELAVERSGVSWVHLRPTWFSQNFNTYWHAPITAADVIPLPAADSKTAFIDARDIARSAVAALIGNEIDGRAFELTGPEALTYEDAAAVLSEISGREIRYQSVEPSAFHKNMTDAGMPADYADLLVALFETVRAGVASNVTDHVEQLTGRKPYRLREYAQDHRGAWPD
ncbi:MAG: SDR family oxidoreductase [Myxococcota bacterium]